MRFMIVDEHDLATGSHASQKRVHNGALVVIRDFVKQEEAAHRVVGRSAWCGRVCHERACVWEGLELSLAVFHLYLSHIDHVESATRAEKLRQLFRKTPISTGGLQHP